MPAANPDIPAPMMIVSYINNRLSRSHQKEHQKKQTDVKVDISLRVLFFQRLKSPSGFLRLGLLSDAVDHLGSQVRHGAGHRSQLRVVLFRNVYAVSFS